jgi:precorrin-6Y C5,15-methyltransferase (decarboxylating)
MENKIYIVGVGPGSKETMTREAADAIERAGCVVGAKRHTGLAETHGNFIPLGNFSETFDRVETELAKHPVAVMVSGDPGIFSLMRLIKERFGTDRIKVIPGVSSLQSIAAVLAESWIDAKVLSGHGRDVKESRVLYDIDRNASTVFFCGPQKDPGWLADKLEKNGLSHTELTVGERLSYPDQKVTNGSPSEFLDKSFNSTSIVFIKNPKPTPARSLLPRDDEFIRTEVPMTKSEVRSIIIEKLALESGSVLWDIGAGTGSISVAAALQSPDLEVHAIECNPEAVELLHRNRDKFRLFNMHVHEGKCPEALSSLPLPTHVFIGGSNGGMEAIINEIAQLGTRLRLVVSCVTLKSISEAATMTESAPFNSCEVLQVAICKGKRVGRSTIMAARNPITIFTAQIDGEVN